MSEPAFFPDNLVGVLFDDWLGLAVYLAEAVDAEQLDVATAQAELGVAVDVADLAALSQALHVAAERFGPTGTATRLLQSAFVGSLEDRVA